MDMDPDRLGPDQVKLEMGAQTGWDPQAVSILNSSQVNGGGPGS